jgi:hypothetical protein
VVFGRFLAPDVVTRQFTEPEMTVETDAAAKSLHKPLGATPAGALAFGALALAVVAVGVVAIGRLAIGRMAVGRVRLGKVVIDELVVRRFRRPDLPD